MYSCMAMLASIPYSLYRYWRINEASVAVFQMLLRSLLLMMTGLAADIYTSL